MLGAKPNAVEETDGKRTSACGARKESAASSMDPSLPRSWQPYTACMHGCETRGAVSVQIPAVKGSKLNFRALPPTAAGNTTPGKSKRYGSIEGLTSAHEEWTLIATCMLKGNQTVPRSVCVSVCLCLLHLDSK